jgi:hypothetical protein
VIKRGIEDGELVLIEVLRAPVQQEDARTRSGRDLSRTERQGIELQCPGDRLELGRRDPRLACLELLDKEGAIPRSWVLRRWRTRSVATTAPISINVIRVYTPVAPSSITR